MDRVLTRVEIAMYVAGFALAGMIGGAIGGSLAAEHGRARVLPAAIAATILGGAAIGWALNGWIAFVRAAGSP